MSKRIRDYVKYTLSELENYTVTEGSCVKKVNSSIHLNFPPYGLGNFKQTLLQLIAKKKIGHFDARLQGIILEVRNIKVIGTTGALRFDDPSIHLDITADCYVFQPRQGAIVKGLVKYISPRQIGVTIYRVFSVSIRLRERVDNTVRINSEIEFKIIKFDLKDLIPYIEGELVTREISQAESIEVSTCNGLNSEPNVEDIKIVISDDEDSTLEHQRDNQSFVNPKARTRHTEYDDKLENNKSNKKSRKRRKEKDSDAEDDGEEPLLQSVKIENVEESESGAILEKLNSIKKEQKSPKQPKQRKNEKMTKYSKLENQQSFLKTNLKVHDL